MLKGRVVAEGIQDGLEVQALILWDGEITECSWADKTERRLELDVITYLLAPETRSLRK